MPLPLPVFCEKTECVLKNFIRTTQLDYFFF